MEELLALPQEVSLPSADYVSTRPGWSGRNSDAKLCANITIPPPAQAPAVDKLLEEGRSVAFDCSGHKCPQVLYRAYPLHVLATDSCKA